MSIARHVPDGDARQPLVGLIASELERLRSLSATLQIALRDGRSAPDDAGMLSAWLSDAGHPTGAVSQPQLEALISLGVLGRVISAGEARIVSIPPGATPPVTARPGSEIDAFIAIAGLIATVLPPGRSIPDEPAALGELLAESPAAAIEVSPRHIEALVALGLLGRLISGGTSRLAGMPQGWAAHAAGEDSLDAATEEFRLDLSIDVEHERLLLYRIAFAFELVAAIIIVRQIVLGLL